MIFGGKRNDEKMDVALDLDEPNKTQHELFSPNSVSDLTENDRWRFGLAKAWCEASLKYFQKARNWIKAQ